MSNDDETGEKIPPCAAFMGCLCAGHARGDDADAPCDTSETPRAKRTKVVVVLEIEGDPDDALYVVDSVLDIGLFQESINGHDLDASPLKVASAVTWVKGSGEACPACEGES